MVMRLRSSWSLASYTGEGLGGIGRGAAEHAGVKIGGWGLSTVISKQAMARFVKNYQKYIEISFIF